MFQLKKYIRVSFVALKIDAKVEEKLTSAFKGFDMRNLAKKKMTWEIWQIFIGWKIVISFYLGINE